MKKETAFKIMEMICFVGFSIVAGWFASGVLEQFFSQKTSFAQLEEKVTDYPVITIAPLFRQASNTNLTNNVIITYWTEGMMLLEGNKPVMQKLEIGENILHNR